MSFSFRYKSVKLKTGSVIRRPMIPLTFDGKEKIDVIAMLDSGSDMTIIPKELADILVINYIGPNEISGIDRTPVQAKEGYIEITFGKAREIYQFKIPVLVPLNEKEGMPIIIGRAGFFDKFKITFSESERKIEFKKAKTFNF
jgi:hypothetical protein